MKKMIEKMILETINNTVSIMPLFKTGYEYSQVLNWCNELEKEGLICRNEDDIRILSVSGCQKLNEYNKISEKTMYYIKPLKQYETEKLGVEDVFLP